MKVAFLTSAFPALSETFIVNQIVGLLDAGHEVDIYARRPETDEPTHAIIDRYRLLERVHHWPTPPRRWLARARDAATRYRAASPTQRRLLRRALNVGRFGRRALSLRLFYEALPCDAGRSYDIIHAHFGSRGLIGDHLRQLGALRGPLVVSFHGEDATPRTRGRRRRAYQPMFRRAEVITVNSRFTGERVERLGCPPGKIVRVPMGVDAKWFACAERADTSTDSSTARQEVLTVARLVEVKGLAYAIRAVASLKERFPRIRYRIVGEGPMRSELEALITALGVADHVQLLGALPQERVLELYRQSQVFVLPSVTTEAGRAEAQGLVLQEAQATGLPVVATRTGGIPDSVLEGESGALVDERDPAALAEAIGALLADPVRAAAMGRAGRSFIERHFSLEHTTQLLLAAYDQAVRGHRPPA